MRQIEVPAGVIVQTYDSWSCSGTREYITGPAGRSLGGDRCALYISLQAGWTCGACETGKYRSDGVVGEPSRCSQCTAGQCPVGQYRKACATTEDSSCAACTAAPGHYCPLGSASSAGVACPEGLSCAGGSADKQPCPDGWNKDTTGSSSCSPPCEAGYFYQNASCVPCPAGSYRTSDDLDCVLCPAGLFAANESSISCTPCPAGTFLTEMGANSSAACSPCPQGRYSSTLSATALAVCKECPNKTNTASPGSTSLHDCKCVPGYHGPDGRAPCTACQDGQYQNSLGGDCLPCGFGNFSIAASVACFSLEIAVAGEWKVVSTSAGSGASQSVELRVGISRSQGIEEMETWASGVIHTARESFGHTYTQSSSTSQTVEVGGEAGFSFGGFSIGGSASSSTTSHWENSHALQRTADQEIANEISQEHAVDAASGAGVVWQCSAQAMLPSRNVCRPWKSARAVPAALSLRLYP